MNINKYIFIKESLKKQILYYESIRINKFT